jgi:uncharacterized membrane protein YgcG
MKFRLEFGRSGLASLVLGAAGACAWADETAFIRSFDAPNGETYSAVSLKSDGTAKAVPHDHVVLVDTSASQVGEYRQQSLAVVESLLKSLPATDRVAVLAVDLAATPLTAGMVDPAAAVQAAVPALQQRFPAGATNLLAALKAAQSQISGERPASIIYVGDGMSSAHLLDPAEAQALLSELRGRQVPVHGMAIGPNRDVRLLGILASQTGGVLLLDDWRNDAQQSVEQLGRELAQAVDQPVWYPSAMETTAEVLPSQPLPLRGDRATVVLARGDVVGKQIVLKSNDGVEKAWNLGAPQSAHGNTFLYNLWSGAEANPTLGAGLAGDNVVAYAQTAFEDHVTALENAGIQALDAKDLARAEAIGFAIRSIDPQNVRAVGLINSAIPQLAQVTDAAPPPADGLTADEIVPVDPNAPVEPPAQPGLAPEDPLAPRLNPATDRQDLIGLAKAKQDALAQKMQGQVDATKQAANQVLNVDPGQSLDMLQRMRNSVKSATDISPEARENMLRDLNTFTQYVQVQAQRREQELEALQRRERVNEAQAQLIEKTLLDDQKMEQLVDRVRALMIDFRAGDDVAIEEAEMVSRLIVNLRPGNPLGMAAVTVTEAAGQLRKAARMRALRADKFLETLYQVELSHVPFPDEPPILYPPAEVWQALTERRKKWNSVDLRQNNPNEQRIYDALDKKVDLEFIDTELSQVLSFLSERYQIPIRPDETRMTEFGVGLDTQVNLVISGVSLRSALKLILEQLDLTYIIEDEVMKITTAEFANQQRQTRVYPVADLVIPIQPLMGGGGFGQQLGGQQGGQGGMGGGGGLGGGGVNVNVGGGGGGGGGFFSVPTEGAPATFNNAAIDALKKKP